MFFQMICIVKATKNRLYFRDIEEIKKLELKK